MALSQRRLSPSLAYSLTDIDVNVSADRDEGEARRVPLRAVLRIFASSIGRPELLNPSSDSSLGALLSTKRNASHGAGVLHSIMSSSAEEKARVCLVSANFRLLSPREADHLSEEERVGCVPVANTDKVAQRLPSASMRKAHVVVTVSKRVASGARDATLELQRVGISAVKMSVVSSAGIRKHVPSGEIPAVLLDRLFANAEVRPSVPLSVSNMRSNEVPDFLRLAIVDFLERRVRLQVMCTAALPAPASRPVALDRAYLRQTEHLAVRAFLHKASSSCICKAHGKSFNVPGVVQVDLQTCGRTLERNDDGCLRCPCHSSALDSNGNARFSVDGLCTEGTKIYMACNHRDGSAFRRGVCVEHLSIDDADRRELSTILVAADEFFGRTTKLFSNRVCNNPKKLAHHVHVLEERFKVKMQSVERDQLERQDPEVHNPRSLLQRDMVAVDLMRGGGVFRHVIKRGARRNQPYLSRAKGSAETVSLTAYERGLIDTHGHLFRKAL